MQSQNENGDISVRGSISDEEIEVDEVNNSTSLSRFARSLQALMLIPEDLDLYEESRREEIMTNLERSQRQNLIQSGALCFIPCCFPIMILMSSFSDRGVTWY